MAQAPYLFPTGSTIGADNLVLRARATRHVVDGFSAPTSIKTVISGEVAWTVNARKLFVDPSSFLVISANEKYSMNILEACPIETCCVFFAEGFVEQIASDMTRPVAQSFDLGQVRSPVLSYLSALHEEHGRSIIQRVQSLSSLCEHALSPSGFEEQFIDLASDVLHLYEQIRKQIARLPAIKSSTKQELFRRLLLGREYLHSNASASISLASVAGAAGLSLFHFHRCFTQVFRQTPHSYLTSLRLSRARQHLEAGSSVIEACLSVGFSSPSSFARLFKDAYGELPSALNRKIARSDQKFNSVSITLTP